MADQKENSEMFLEEVLLSPYTYFSQIKGKELRNKVVIAFNHWLQIPTEKLNYVIDVGQMIYASFAMCDDIQDNSIIRGTSPATHCAYGIPHTINASLHVLLLTLKKSLDDNPEAYNMIIEDYLAIYRGQGTEIYWRDNFICPTEEQFRKMIEKKSARFFILATRFLQLFSENKTDYSKLALIVGNYFQVYDDYCNLNYQKGVEGWPGNEDKKVINNDRFCEDITEGKFTLPIVHAMQTKYGEEILNILRQRTSDVSLKKHCLLLLEKSGSMQYARDAILEFDREARAEVARLGGNPEFEAVLDEFLDCLT